MVSGECATIVRAVAESQTADGEGIVLYGCRKVGGIVDALERAVGHEGADGALGVV